MSEIRTYDHGEEMRCRIVAFMGQYTAEHGVSPTMAEIGKAVGLTSRSTVSDHLQVLVRRGVCRTHRRGSGHVYLLAERVGT